MASFVWNPDIDLIRRYEGVDIDERALGAWRQFLERLIEQYPSVDALTDYILTLQSLPIREARLARVFVSHRFIDTPFAKRIAWLACQKAGLEYWLDVHDPVLLLAGKKLPSGDPRRPFLIAAILEIALLSCTHVIAAHTLNSTGSKWIPYELARAKGRSVISRQAAGWFHSATSPSASGEYVLLAGICRSDLEVKNWLLSHAMSPVTPRPFHDVSVPPPPPLP